MLTLCFLAAFAWATSLAATRSYTLTLENRVIDLDSFRRSAIVINGESPGLLITAKKGDDVEVHVRNRLTDHTMAVATSIHWHGLLMRNAASEDGVAWITQCPIASGDDYTYRFNVGEQTGTYWYHSHVTSQYCDGLRGPLIIYDDPDPFKDLYDVDNESTIFMLHEWFFSPSPRAFRNLEPPLSVIVNKRGRTWDSNNTLPVTLSVTNVTQGKRYRFRVINAGCLVMSEFSVDGHSLTIIELDGTKVNPKVTDGFVIHPGQRVSAVLHANQPIANYWIRTKPSYEGLAANHKDGHAILRYKGAGDSFPLTQSKAGASIIQNEEGITPYRVPDKAIREADIKIDLSIAYNGFGDHFLVNHAIFAAPPVPVLLQIMNGVDPRKLMPNGSVITLPRNKLVELSLPGGALFGPHPFHLHGHSFEVIRSVNSTTYNRINPPIRDVVSTGDTGDNTTIRFTTDNPGPWYEFLLVER
ncbi:hypothetical protein HGRIS_009415 [Hohenbuehelia grisea]|uniref:Laccase n=1 Tax=Hohenbuehelia grisea TaxID=104357 RepID=A0ABR3J2H6_9AGAR